MTTPHETVTFLSVFDTYTTPRLCDDWGPARSIGVVCADQGVAWNIQVGPTNVGPWSLLASGTGDFRQDYDALNFRYIQVQRLPSETLTDPTVAASLTAQAAPDTQTALDDVYGAVRAATEHEAVTLGADFPITIGGGVTRALWVGTGGDVSCTVGGVTLTYGNVPSGSRLDVAATDVSSLAHGTTARDIVAWA